MTVQLAAELGYGIPWLINTLVIVLATATAFFIYTILSTRIDHIAVAGFDKVNINFINTMQKGIGGYL